MNFYYLNKNSLLELLHKYENMLDGTYQSHQQKN